MLRHATCSIQKCVAFVISHFSFLISHFHDPRSLHIRILVLFALLTLAHDGAAEGLLCHIEKTQFATIGNHVAIQLQVVTLWITPHQPCLSVVINHYGGIDMVPRAILKQRFSQGIAERTSR